MPALSCTCASTVFSVILFPWTSTGTPIGVVEFKLRLKDRTTSLPLASKKSSAITVSLILMERTPFSCERRAELLIIHERGQSCSSHRPRFEVSIWKADAAHQVYETRIGAQAVQLRVHLNP